MNVAYFKQLSGDDHCQISFRLNAERYNIDKVFNFNRSSAEQIDTSLERMRQNIEKELQKRHKRKKNKNTATPAQSEDPPVELPPVQVNIGTREAKFTGITVAEMLARIGQNPDVFLTVLENEFRIVYNKPEVHALVLPSSMMADFYVYPSKLELHFATRSESDYRWYRGLPPVSNGEQIVWEEVGQEFTYLVPNRDVGYYLKFVCTPKSGDQTGPDAVKVTDQTVQAGPGQCPFEVRHLFTQQKLTGGQFRVVSYNLLADVYADSDYSRNVLFAYCVPYALALDYRKQLFVKELVGYQADLLCLQEVDGKVFELDLMPILRQNRYVGHYQAKCRVAEGLATFYDTEKFELVEKHGVIISNIMKEFPELWDQIKGNEPLVKRISHRSTALQVTLLQSKHDRNKHLLVANTHLYFHPDADHIRLLQFGFAMLYVRRQYERILGGDRLSADDVALLFCGDFNSDPESGIYKLMIERFVGPDMPDWQSNELEAVQNVSLAQPFQMGSACGCPKFTNYTLGFTECIDYIFFQTSLLRVLPDAVPMPSEEELTVYEAIPSPVFPSDHIALVTNLEWTRCDE
ncbi:2',5'-phosphodiesterase 12 [Anopheles bellator]|uniref:2',5'-phosphodiesterase 12 n=1 Tax=Anopheles bellator TaxID=139047 RepID=UPI002648452C|nr:2',5'-phosphodiesterase 12 [Anopheles bellator]